METRSGAKEVDAEEELEGDVFATGISRCQSGGDVTIPIATDRANGPPLLGDSRGREVKVQSVGLGLFGLSMLLPPLHAGLFCHGVQHTTARSVRYRRRRCAAIRCRSTTSTHLAIRRTRSHAIATSHTAHSTVVTTPWSSGRTAITGPLARGAALAHGQHVAVDIDLLTAKSLGSFSVQNFQGSAVKRRVHR